MLTEAGVLVPFWRALAPADFFAWYAANDRRLVRFFGPLTLASALLALAAAVASVWTGHPGRLYAAVAAAVSLSTLSMLFLYFLQANARFAAAALDPQRLASELTRWAAWHWTRTGLSVAALGAGLLALAGRQAP